VYFDRVSGDSVAMVSNGSLAAARTVELQRELVAAMAGAQAQAARPPEGVLRADDRARAALAGTCVGEAPGLYRCGTARRPQPP